MKLLGKDNFQRTGKFRFTVGTQGYCITICSLPYGFDNDMKKFFPEPRPPERPVHGPKGEPIYKPGSSSILLTEPDEKDPGHLIRMEHTDTMRGVWMIYHGLKFETDWEWEAKEQDFKTKEDFCKALYEELKAANIPVGVMGSLVTAISELSSDAEEKIEEATKDFLSDTGSATSEEPKST